MENSGLYIFGISSTVPTELGSEKELRKDLQIASKHWSLTIVTTPGEGAALSNVQCISHTSHFLTPSPMNRHSIVIIPILQMRTKDRKI